jgi:hypothetical protein
MLCKNTSQISSHQVTTVRLRFRPFLYGALCSIRNQPFWTCLEVQVAAWRQNTYPHARLTCPSTTGHEFLTERHSPHAKIETHCVLRHLTMFLGGPASLNLLHHSTTHLRETLVAARRHKTIHTCLLQRKICGRMMVFHVRRAVTPSFKLLCKNTNYILAVDI